MVSEKNEKEKLVIELRWDPLLEEWVMVSNIREARPWRPQSFCPFCPGAPEMGYGWKVKIVENKFPMLIENAPRVEPHWFYRKAEARGKCLVVVETPEHDLDDISDLDLDSIVLVIREVIRAMKEYMDKDWAKYFFWFRNKGEEIGVSLKHPHSQIYILPFIPVRVERELRSAKKYYDERRECLFCRIIQVEETDNERVVFRTTKWISFIPFYAHWPFEVHIYPRRHVQLLTELDNEEIRELALSIKRVLQGLKALFNKPVPYMMIFHQAPLRGSYPYYHLHVEIYGVYRPSGKLKYAAGMESGGGNFTYDSVPEKNAQKLRDAINSISSYK
ncbi:MAG: galactose-1-phosphate uridylyltransferase [Thermoprotei archaeon]